ncbi:MAG: sugar ABC transporter permease [Nitriliruptoraceae bacterium]
MVADAIGGVRLWWRRHPGAATATGIAPALLVVGALFGAAILAAFSRSFGAMPDPLGAYRVVVADPEFRAAAAMTIAVAVTSTAMATVLGVAAALGALRLVRGRRTLLALFQANLAVPHVIGAIAMLNLLGQSGFVARIAGQAGLIDGPASFPALVHDPASVAVIAHYVWKEVPFVALVTLAILRAAGEGFDEAARTLGASRWQRLRSVTLPLVLPGVLPAALVVFAFTFGTFEVPLLLGRSYPAMLPVLAHKRFIAVDLAARPEAMAIAVIISVFVLFVVVLGAVTARRAIRRVAT